MQLNIKLFEFIFIVCMYDFNSSWNSGCRRKRTNIVVLTCKMNCCNVCPGKFSDKS